MKKSLKSKILIGVPAIFIAVMLVITVVISLILSKQNRKAANTFIQNAFNIARYTISERQEKLLFDSRQMASIDDMGRKIKYVMESSSYFKYDTLRPTYVKIASVIYSTSTTADVWKANIYNLNGELMAFTIIEENGNTLGCVHNRETIEIASLKPAEELTDESWIKKDILPAGTEYSFGSAILDKEAIHFEIIDNSLCLVAYVPVMGKDYNAATEKMEAKQVGMVVTVQKLGAAFVKKMSELSGTNINIFTQNAMLSGTYAAYKTFDLSGFADVKSGWTLNGQPVTFNDVDISEGSYFQGVLPIYSGSKCVAAIVSLYSKEMAKANTMQIIKLLSLVYFVGVILIVPITILVVVRGVINPIQRTAFMMRQIAHKKDFTKMLNIESQDEIGDLASSFNEMTENLCKTTTSIDNLNREIAERKKAEQRQAQLLEQVENINQELKDFAYVVSHDLKAPLRGIKTLAEWITTDYADKLDDNGKEQMNLLAGRVDRMHNLIDGILQYSRVGRTEEEKVVVNLNELVPEIIDMIAPPENITITIENELPTVECEQTRIMQVFQNLLSNAVKYMDKPQGQIKVGCVEEDGFWEFYVADNGPGIEEKYFEKIFQLFQTLAPRDESESTGIGLTIIKKIVEIYGGKTWVQSKVGSGSTFFFTLPKTLSVINNEKQLLTSSC
jgi:signal transduction histidine kinase